MVLRLKPRLFAHIVKDVLIGDDFATTASALKAKPVETGNVLGAGTCLMRLRYREENSNRAGQIVRRLLLLK